MLANNSSTAHSRVLQFLIWLSSRALAQHLVTRTTRAHPQQVQPAHKAMRVPAPQLARVNPPRAGLYYKPHFTLQQNFENSFEHRKGVFTCFVNLEKTYDRVPREKLRVVLPEYGVDGCLLLAVKSLYSCSKVCVRVGRVKSGSLVLDSDKGVCCHRCFS